MDYSEGQDAPSAGASHPVEELSGGPTGLLLQSDQHLDQHQAFNTSTIQTQQSVHPSKQRIKRNSEHIISKFHCLHKCNIYEYHKTYENIYE